LGAEAPKREAIGDKHCEMYSYHPKSAPQVFGSREISLKTFNLFSHGKVLLLSPFIAMIQTINMRGNLVETSCYLGPEWIQFRLQPSRKSKRSAATSSSVIGMRRNLSQRQNVLEVKQ